MVVSAAEKVRVIVPFVGTGVVVAIGVAPMGRISARDWPPSELSIVRQ